MQLEDVANLATSITLVSTSIIPITLSLRTKMPKIPSLVRGVRISQVSMFLLGLFLLLHGLYHASEFVGNDFYSDDILEPISILTLLIFSIYVAKNVFVPSNSKVEKRNVKRAPKANPAKQTQKSISIKNNSIFTLITIPFLAGLPLTILDSFSNNPSETFSLLGIIASAVIFVWMAVRNPNIHAQHFQFAIIVLIWTAAEIPHNLDSIGVISLSSSFDTIGTWVHFFSMFLIGMFICVRVIKVSLFSQRPRRPRIANEL
jgi:hypothetical protein